MAIIAASILNADFSQLAQEIQSVSGAGVDLFTLDVMDGHFVPNLTFGDYVVARVRELTSLPMEVHLMVDNPGFWIDRMCHAGADIITFHIEATNEPEKLIQAVRDRGLFVGIALNIETPVSSIVPLLHQVDLINFLAVPVGFGGQAFRPETLERVQSLRQLIDRSNLSVAIEVDGGIKYDNSAEVANAGVDILTVGTGIYHAANRLEAVRLLRQNTSGERDLDTRRRVVRLLKPVNLPESRGPETLGRLRMLRDQLGVATTSWPGISSTNQE